MLKELFSKKIGKNNEFTPISKKKAWFLIYCSLIIQGFLVMMTTFALNGLMNKAELQFGSDWYAACLLDPVWWTVMLLLVCEILIFGDYIVRDAIKLNDRVRIGEIQSKDNATLTQP